MLHELIFALNGYTGRIFIHNKESNEVTVDSYLPFVHPSEVAILNRVLKLSSYFLQLQQFVEDKQAGIYLNALKDGILGILHEYRKVLIDLEAELLKDKNLTLSYIQSQLENYQLVLFTLVHLSKEILSNKISGCCVLSLLHKESFSGDSLLSEIILKLLNKCSQVFYYQLASWIFKGILPTQENEFFIYSKNKILLVNKQTEADKNIKFVDNYYIANDLLPVFISVKVCQQILFIGESIGNFEISKTRTMTNDCLLELNDMHRFSKELRVFSRESRFPVEKFEEFIENIRSHISQKFYKIIVINHDLINQLMLVKEFFLMGRGEFYLVFINQAKVLLHTPITKTTQYEVNQIFQKAAHDVFLQDGIVDRFKFVIENESAAEDSWSSLTLIYKCEWPFHTIFTKDVLAKYNQLLRFLLKMKRVELALNRTWMVGRRKPISAIEPHTFLRNHMSFFVNNFQYYLQVDVIESQTNMLMEKIRSTTDFEEILLAHDRFLASLFAQCFLNADITHKCCNEILNLCLSFCRLILNTDGNVPQQKLQHISKVFGEHTRLLLQLLSSVEQRNKHTHLSQLLLRVDFNSYFSNRNSQNK